MATPLETIPEETQTPPNSPTPTRVTAEVPKTKPAKEKTLAALSLVKGWQNATAWQGRLRKERKLRGAHQVPHQVLHHRPHQVTTATRYSSYLELVG